MESSPHVIQVMGNCISLLVRKSIFLEICKYIHAFYFKIVYSLRAFTYFAGNGYFGLWSFGSSPWSFLWKCSGSNVGCRRSIWNLPRHPRSLWNVLLYFHHFPLDERRTEILEASLRTGQGILLDSDGCT